MCTFLGFIMLYKYNQPNITQQKKEVNFKHPLDIFVDMFIKWTKWRENIIFFFYKFINLIIKNLVNHKCMWDNI